MGRNGERRQRRQNEKLIEALQKTPAVAGKEVKANSSDEFPLKSRPIPRLLNKTRDARFRWRYGEKKRRITTAEAFRPLPERRRTAVPGPEVQASPDVMCNTV